MKNVVKIGVVTLMQLINVAQAQEKAAVSDHKVETAQPSETFNCPFNQIFEQAAKNNPNFKQELMEHENRIALRVAKYKTTANQTRSFGAKAAAQYDSVPVIFHVVLNAAQMAQMGGQNEIINRIKSQLAALNEDFNEANADSTQIPSAFKPLYANMNIRFGLAHTDPNGNYTPGYEFVNTTKSGFDGDYGTGTYGSTNFASDAKYAAGGGADAWDTQKYLNIWVINLTPSGLGGLGTPPPYSIYGGTSLLPWAEQGIAISYGALGRRQSVSQYFPFPTAVQGRALVHEVGHFFNLFHTFGMQTLVNTNCSDDDGVSDTPSQYTYSQTNPTFPLTDNCSPVYPGVMFMNHMDYTNDKHRVMFSIGQRDRALVETDPAGYRYELFKHPELLGYGFSVGINDNKPASTFKVHPNPASDECTISYQAGNIPASIVVVNQIGQRLIEINNNNLSELKIDLRSLEKGLYFVRSQFKNSTVTTKLVVN